jgi:hypothetical protein
MLMPPAVSNLDRYLQALEHCASNAQSAPTDEIRQLWLRVQESYRFLIALETRPEKPHHAFATSTRRADVAQDDQRANGTTVDL